MQIDFVSKMQNHFVFEQLDRTWKRKSVLSAVEIWEQP